MFSGKIKMDINGSEIWAAGYMQQVVKDIERPSGQRCLTPGLIYQ